jgi:hypothetical protein
MFHFRISQRGRLGLRGTFRRKHLGLTCSRPCQHCWKVCRRASIMHGLKVGFVMPLECHPLELWRLRLVLGDGRSCNSGCLHNIFYSGHHQSKMTVVASSIIGLYDHTVLIQVLFRLWGLWKSFFVRTVRRGLCLAEEVSVISTSRASYF